MKKQLSLADFLPYLLNRAGVKIGLSFARDIAAYDVSLPMWRVMAVLWENGDQRLGDIAERTSIDISTLSRLLGTLETRQFVVRRRSGNDGRALSVSLTAKGREMAGKVIPVALHYEDVALRGFSSADTRKLKQMLVMLFSNLHAFDHKAETDRNVRGGGAARGKQQKRAT